VVVWYMLCCAVLRCAALCCVVLCCAVLRWVPCPSCPQDFDVLLVFHDGLDSFERAVLHARVAPVQAVVWGMGVDHVMATGMRDTVDYHITGDWVVPSAAYIHRETSAQVVRLGGLGMFHARAARPTPQLVHDMVIGHSLFSSRRLYLCPAVLAHIHPRTCVMLQLLLAS